MEICFSCFILTPPALFPTHWNGGCLGNSFSFWGQIKMRCTFPPFAPPHTLMAGSFKTHSKLLVTQNWVIWLHKMWLSHLKGFAQRTSGISDILKSKNCVESQKHNGLHFCLRTHRMYYTEWKMFEVQQSLSFTPPTSENYWSHLIKANYSWAPSLLVLLWHTALTLRCYLYRNIFTYIC